MKGIVIISLILLNSIASIAQVGFGTNAGLNLSKITGEWDKVIGSEVNPKFMVGFNLGYFVEIPMSEKYFFQPELAFSSKGVLFKEIIEETGVLYGNSYYFKAHIELSQKINYLEFPFLFKYLNNGFNLIAGPYLGVLLSANSKEKAEGTSSFYDYMTGENLTVAFSESYTHSGTEGFNSIDLGLVIGIGYELPFGLGFQARLVKGFLDIIEENEDYVPFTNTTIQVNLNYRFVGNRRENKK